MPLNPKQQKFCEEYLIDLNATQAAIRAGYSKKTAYAIGSENLTKPEIHAYIENLKRDRSERTLIEADFVILGLKEVALRCMINKPVMEWNYRDKMLQQKRDDDGNGVYEFDSNGANRSLELLGRHLGIFEKDNSQSKPETIINVTVPD
jgi:phage terminase small subunit